MVVQIKKNIIGITHRKCLLNPQEQEQEQEHLESIII
jgi:hypothetical protein